MKQSRLSLGKRLSTVSWFFIETLFLIGVFALPFSKSVTEGTLWIALSLWVLRKFPFNEKWPAFPFLNAVYAAFLVLTLVSLAQVPPALFFTGLRGFFKWLKFILVFFMSVELFQDPKRVSRFLRVFLVSMALTCLDGFYQLQVGHVFIKHY